MRKVLVFVALGSLSTALFAQSSAPAASGYLTPPKAIVDILDAPPPPTVELSGSGAAMAVLERASMPTIAELAQPMLRLAGVRINPKTNGLHRAVRYRSLTLKNPADGTERKVTLPPLRRSGGSASRRTAPASLSRTLATTASSCGWARPRPARPRRSRRRS